MSVSCYIVGPTFPAYPAPVEDLTPAPLLAAREKWRALKQKKAEAEAKIQGESQPIPTVSSSRIDRIDFSPLGEDLDDEEGTPTKDEQENRAGTPVQDEMEPEIKTEAKSKVANPIEFLTQLISQTQQSQTSSQSSTDFMQSLSALTRNVQYSSEGSSGVQGGWGGWKEPKPEEENFAAVVPQPVSAPLSGESTPGGPGGMAIPVPPPVVSTGYTPPAAIPMPVAPPSLQPSLTMPPAGPRPMSSMSPLTPPAGVAGLPPVSSQPPSLHGMNPVTSPTSISPQNSHPHTPLHGQPPQTPPTGMPTPSPLTPTPPGMQHPPNIPQPIPPPRGMLPPQTPPGTPGYRMRGPHPGFGQQPPRGPRFGFRPPGDGDPGWQRPPRSPHGQYNQQSPPLNNTPSPKPLTTNSRPNLTQIRTVDLDQSKETFRQVTSPPAFRSGPRPPFPSHGGHQNVQDEFTEKLRRKTSVTSPTTPGVSSNLRNLTLVSTSEDARPADTPMSSSPGSTGTASSTPAASPRTATPNKAANDWNRPAPHNASGDWGRPKSAAADWGSPVRPRTPSTDGAPSPGGIHVRPGSNGEAPAHPPQKGFRERQPGRFGHWPRLPSPAEGNYRDPYGRPHPKRMPQQGAFMRYWETLELRIGMNVRRLSTACLVLLQRMKVLFKGQGPVYIKEDFGARSRALSQYKDGLSRYGGSHYYDMTVRPSYLYNGNPYCGKMVYWGGPLVSSAG